MARLREHAPTHLGGQRVTRIRDAAAGTDHDPATGSTSRLDLPEENLLAFDLEHGRALARPSGTEPKFKIYYELVVTAGATDDLQALRRDAAPQLDRIRIDVLEAAGLPH